MPIVTSYPFKKAPLNSVDEINISDVSGSVPGFRTKTTSLEVLAKYIMLENSFIFTQSVASETWVIKHNLNKFPSVTTVDSQVTPAAVIGNVTYNNKNQCTITFSAPFNGKAFCN